MISVRCLPCGRYDSGPVALNKGNVCPDFMTFQFRYWSDRMGDNKQIQQQIYRKVSGSL